MLIVICLVTLVLSLATWIVGYWLPLIRFQRLDIMPYPGGFNLILYWDPTTLYNEESEQEWSWRGARVPGFKGHLQNAFLFHVRKAGSFTAYLTPLGPVILLSTGIAWILFIPLHRRRIRRKKGLCLNCGYDLRASVNRCPECEESIPKETRVKLAGGTDP